MKLVDILARELKVWPEHGQSLEQGSSGRIYKHGTSIWTSVCTLAEDLSTAVVTRAQWQAAVDTLKAESAPAWVGIGMPPAGQCVEVHRGPATWIEKDEWQIGKTAEVMSAFTNSRGHGIAAIQFPSGHCECILSACLKPVRTPEQIAAEERERGISQVLADFEYTVGPCTHKLARSQAERIWDAGYRKQEADK